MALMPTSSSTARGFLHYRRCHPRRRRGALRGWTKLEAIPVEWVTIYQPYGPLAAHLLTALNREREARAAYDRVIGLCENAVM